MKPLIGITTGEIINELEPWSGIVYGQKQSYSDAIIAGGGIPVLVPFMPEAELRQVYARLDGILFAGGNDINPKLYGEKQNPLTKHVSDARDRVEISLLTWALQDDKPLLAICRGFQLLNAHLGGTLYQDITTSLAGASDHELSNLKKDVQHVAHHLKVVPGSRLATVTGATELRANTHHHQGVKDVAPSLVASAWAEDGLVEGLEDSRKKFMVGVQCHPESLQGGDEAWARLFEAFVKSTSS